MAFYSTVSGQMSPAKCFRQMGKEGATKAWFQIKELNAKVCRCKGCTARLFQQWWLTWLNCSKDEHCKTGFLHDDLINSKLFATYSSTCSDLICSSLFVYNFLSIFFATDIFLASFKFTLLPGFHFWFCLLKSNVLFMTLSLFWKADLIPSRKSKPKNWGSFMS